MADASNYAVGGGATGATTSGVDVSDIMSAYKNFQASAAASIGDFVKTLGAAKTASASEQEGISRTAEADAAIEAITSATTLERNADVKGAAAAVGADKNASNFAMLSLMERQASGEHELAGRRDMIQSKLDQAFLDNPVQWVVNQFTLPFDIAAAANIKEKVTESKDALTRMSLAMTEAGTIINATDQVDEATKSAAITRKLAAQAQVKVAESQERMAQLGISAISVRQALDRGSFEAVMSVFNAGVAKDKLDFEQRQTATSEGHLALSKVQLDEISRLQLKLSQDVFANTKTEQEAARIVTEKRLDFERQNIALATRNTELSEKHFTEVTKPQLQLSRDVFFHTISQDDFHNQLAQKKYNIEYNLAEQSAEKFLFEQQQSRAHLTLAQASFDLQKEFRDLQIADRKEDENGRAVLQLKLNNYTDTMGMRRIPYAEFKLMGPGKQRSAIEAGMQDPSIDQGRIGPTPVTSVQNANTVNAPLTPGARIIANKVLNVMQTTAALPDNQGAKPEELAARQEIAVREALIKEAANIPDEDGIFSPPPLKTVLTIPQVIATPLGKELATLGLANEQFPTRASLVFSTAVGMIEKGQLEPAAAADQIALMYRAINEDNYKTRQYRRFNIIPPTAANGGVTSFRTSVDTGSFIAGMFSSKNIDMANPTAVEAELTRAVIMRASSNQQGAH